MVSQLMRWSVSENLLNNNEILCSLRLLLNEIIFKFTLRSLSYVPIRYVCINVPTRIAIKGIQERKVI